MLSSGYAQILSASLSVGYTRRTDGAQVAVAERVRGARDRLHPTRVSRSRYRARGTTLEADDETVRSLLQRNTDTPIAGKGCAGEESGIATV